jgi:hypothetical protein
MSIEGILIGLLVLAIGAAFAFYGFRVFLILLPIWGFFAGFLLGANGVAALLGGADPGFFATASGWVVGFLLGLLFAVLAYLYYWVAVILLGGALGYQLTIGLLQWIGFDGDGLIAFVLAIIVGAVFAVGFFVLRMPAVLVIVATAIIGAGAMVAGVVVGLGLVPEEKLDQVFDSGIFGVYNLSDIGIVWAIAAVALAFAGAIYQTRTVADMSAAISAESYMNPGIDKQPPSGGAPA